RKRCNLPHDALCGGNGPGSPSASAGDDRDLRQGRGGRGRRRGAWAVVEAHLDAEPVPAGRQDVTEVLAGAGGPENERDADRFSRCETDRPSHSGDPAAVAADGLECGVQQGTNLRLAGAERPDRCRTAVAQDEPAVAVVP